MRKATVVPSAKCDGVRVLLEGRRNEVHSATLNWVLVFGFIPTALAAAPQLLVCSTNTSWPRNCSLLAARDTRAKIHVHSRQELDSVKVCIKSNCSAVLKDDKAPEIRKHLLYLLYSHAAYPRQRASGTCMKQPSRLDIGSCTAESWYVCFPYRHLSWFAVRRSSICLLLCAACCAHHLVSPLYRRGAYANVLPRHGRTLTVEWTFS